MTDAHAADPAPAASTSIEAMLSMLGHELRNPLNAILTAAELLRRLAPGAAQAENARQIIVRQAQQIVRLLDVLPDTGRVLAGDLSLDRVPLDLGAAVRRGVAAARAPADARGQTLHAEPAEVWIDADPQRLAQAIDALLEEARLAAPAGAHLHVHVALEPPHAVLRVADADAAAEARRAATSPTDRSAGPPGRPGPPTRLRLAFAARLVEAHGGSLHAGGTAHGHRIDVRFDAIARPGAAG